MMQAIANGVLLGGLLGLASLGFSLVWGVTDILNVAHGTMVIVGSYLAFFFLNSVLKVDPLWSTPLVLPLMFLVGFLIQKLALNRVVRRGMLLTVLFTFGLNLILQNLLAWGYASDIRSTSTKFAGASLEIGPLVIPGIRLIIFLVALLLAGATHLFLMRTRYGRAIRATALDRDAARLCGVDIGAVYAWTFGAATALAGAAGVLTSMVIPFTPFSGDTFLNAAFVVTVLGGLGNVAGAMFGGLLLGIVQSLGATYINPGYQNAIAFAVFVLVLVVRPQGLFGNRFFAQAN